MDSEVERFSKLLRDQIGNTPGKAILSFSQELDDRLAKVQPMWVAICAKRTSDDEFHLLIEAVCSTLDSIEDYLDTTHKCTYNKKDAELQAIAAMCTDLKTHVRGAKEYSTLLLTGKSEELLHLLQRFLNRIERQIQMLSTALSTTAGYD